MTKKQADSKFGKARYGHGATAFGENGDVPFPLRDGKTEKAPKWAATPLDPKERARYRFMKNEEGHKTLATYDAFYGDYKIAVVIIGDDGKYQANFSHSCLCYCKQGGTWTEFKELFARWFSRNELSKFAKSFRMTKKDLQIRADNKTPIACMPPADGVRATPPEGVKCGAYKPSYLAFR